MFPLQNLACRELRCVLVTACRQRRLSLCSSTSPSMPLMSNAVVLLLMGWNMWSWASRGALTISTTNKSVSFLMPTVCASNSPGAEGMIMESAPHVTCRTTTPAVAKCCIRSFIRRHLLLILLRNSACKIVVNVLPSINMLTEILLYALLDCSTKFMESCWSYASNATLTSCYL